MSETSARQRLQAAQDELVAAERDGRSRDAASWRIAVDVLHHVVDDQGLVVETRTA